MIESRAFLTERGTGLHSMPFVQLSRLSIGGLLSNILGTLEYKAPESECYSELMVYKQSTLDPFQVKRLKMGK